MTSQESGWNEWSKHVLKELERLNTNYQQINDKISNFEHSVKSDIDDIKSELHIVKSLDYSVGDLKSWKQRYDDQAITASVRDLKLWMDKTTEILSPIQLKELKTEVYSQKHKWAVALGVMIAIQAVFTLVVKLF